MLAKLVLQPSFPIHLYEVAVPVNSILLLLESLDRALPSLYWMHLTLLSNFEAELGNTH